MESTLIGKKRSSEESNGSTQHDGHQAAAAASSSSALKKEKLTEAKASEDPFKYMTGFGSTFETEALPNALPVGQNNPQKCAYGLFAEQLSGTAFTVPRAQNMRTWFYRIMPQCVHKPYVKIDSGRLTNDFSKGVVTPNQLRWKPFPIPSPDQAINFVQGLATVGGSGSVDTKTGFSIHIYSANRDMVDTCLSNSDGDFLIVPQHGALIIQTECGLLYVKPTEICVIPRGMKFRVEIPDLKKDPKAFVRGYIAEVYNGHFRLPDLGPIGANGLANPRDFQVPVAAYEDKRDCKYTLIQKFLGELFSAEMSYSPFDAVAWHGNYYPYKYDLTKFVVVNSVSVDHLDPSIFTVLTCPTAEPGVACCDFVIFPPRWAVQEKTFRPPYYHRNCMSEFMGNIAGAYDAKPDGFLPGAGSLHSCMIGHGPDAKAFKAASEAELKPTYMAGALAFMFESTYMMKLTHWGTEIADVDKRYYECWQGIKPEFDPNVRDK